MMEAVHLYENIGHEKDIWIAEARKSLNSYDAGKRICEVADQVGFKNFCCLFAGAMSAIKWGWGAGVGVCFTTKALTVAADLLVEKAKKGQEEQQQEIRNAKFLENLKDKKNEEILLDSLGCLLYPSLLAMLEKIKEKRASERKNEKEEKMSFGLASLTDLYPHATADEKAKILKKEKFANALYKWFLILRTKKDSYTGDCITRNFGMTSRTIKRSSVLEILREGLLAYFLKNDPKIFSYDESDVDEERIQFTALFNSISKKYDSFRNFALVGYVYANETVLERERIEQLPSYEFRGYGSKENYFQERQREAFEIKEHIAKSFEQFLQTYGKVSYFQV